MSYIINISQYPFPVCKARNYKYSGECLPSYETCVSHQVAMLVMQTQPRQKLASYTLLLLVLSEYKYFPAFPHLNAFACSSVCFNIRVCIDLHLKGNAFST